MSANAAGSGALRAFGSGALRAFGTAITHALRAIYVLHTLGPAVHCFAVAGLFGCDIVTGLTHLLTGFLVAEDVQTVDEMEDYVAVDVVVFCVAAAGGGNAAVDVAGLVEDVQPLQGDGAGVLLEDVDGELHVPDEVIAVVGGAAETATALHGDVGVQTEILPFGLPQIDINAVGVVPGGGVVIGLQTVSGVLEADVSVGGHFQPVIAVAGVKTFVGIE